MGRLHRSIITLQNKCVGIVVDTFDSIILEFYLNKWDKISDETTPEFGPIAYFPTTFLILVIEELIRRKKLSYQQLKLMLPKGTKTLTCDEDSEFSPFQIDTIELISKRCKGFEKLHFHKVMHPEEDKNEILSVNRTIRDSIIQLKNLKEINLYDSWIENETIRVIATNCSKLKELNLLRTNLSDEGLNYLYDDESVIKNSLTKLIIDETRISNKSAGQCLLKLQNLTYFDYHRTIEACLFVFEDGKNSKGLDIVPKFKTTFFKSKMDFVDGSEIITQEFQEWLIEKFPKVKHLTLLSILFNQISIVENLIKSWKHILHLELTSTVIINDEFFNLLKPAFEVCSKTLVALKLERISCVNVLYLAKIFVNLKKLSFINNHYFPTNELSSFKNLKEVEIYRSFERSEFKLRECEDGYLYRELFDLSVDSWMALFSSENLEKVFIYNQFNFEEALLISLSRMRNLRNLKELKVFHCHLSKDSILKLFEEGIPVENIEVGFCPNISRIDADEISTIIKKNNYYITLTFLWLWEILIIEGGKY